MIPHALRPDAPLIWACAPGRLCRGNNTLREIVEELHKTFHIGFHAGANDVSMPAAKSLAAEHGRPGPPVEPNCSNAVYAPSREPRAGAAKGEGAQASAADVAARPTRCAEGQDREEGRVEEGPRDTSLHYSNAKATESICVSRAVSSFSAFSEKRTAAAGWFPGVQNSEVRIQFVVSGLSPTKSSGMTYCLPFNWRPRLIFNGCSGFHYRLRPRAIHD